MVGYTVPVWVVLANDTVYQLQQFTWVSRSDAQNTGNGWDALPGSGSDAHNTENGRIHCTSLGGSGEWYSVLVGWNTVPWLWYQMYQLQQVAQLSGRICD
jgi:hypothetical protein